MSDQPRPYRTDHAPSHIDPKRSGCTCICDCSSCIGPTGWCICPDCGPAPHAADDDEPMTQNDPYLMVQEACRCNTPACDEPTCSVHSGGEDS